MPAGAAAAAVLAAGLAGAALLVAAELTTLYAIRSNAYRAGVVQTISTHAHDSWALLPIAGLAALLAAAAALGSGGSRSSRRIELLAVGVLGVAALVIALAGDLPDAQSGGLIGSAVGGYHVASASPRIGLYLETAGAVMLIIAAGVGLLLLAQGHRAGSVPRPTRD